MACLLPVRKIFGTDVELTLPLIDDSELKRFQELKNET